jgi:hypothetical protein
MRAYSRQRRSPPAGKGNCERQRKGASVGAGLLPIFDLGSDLFLNFQSAVAAAASVPAAPTETPPLSPSSSPPTEMQKGDAELSPPS